MGSGSCGIHVATLNTRIRNGSSGKQSNSGKTSTKKEPVVSQAERDATEYVQAMCVVDHILKLMVEEPEVIINFLDMPANVMLVSREFDTIYQRWIDEEA